MDLPPLGDAGSRLTELLLHGTVGLPPDWHQCLRELRDLHVEHDSFYAGPWEDAGGNHFGFEWGGGPLSALTAPTRLDLSRTVLPGALLGQVAIACSCVVQRVDVSIML